jgi:hypothetical protein
MAGRLASEVDLALGFNYHSLADLGGLGLVLALEICARDSGQPASILCGLNFHIGRIDTNGGWVNLSS